MKSKYVPIIVACAMIFPTLLNAQDHTHQQVHEMEDTIADLRAEIERLKAALPGPPAIAGSFPATETTPGNMIAPADETALQSTTDELAPPFAPAEPGIIVDTVPAPADLAPSITGVPGDLVPDAVDPGSIRIQLVPVYPRYNYLPAPRCGLGGSCGYRSSYRPPYAGYDVYRYRVYGTYQQ